MPTREDEFRLEIENFDLRRLLTQAGIDAAEHKVAERLRQIVLEELHHRLKNNLAMVQAIVSQSLRFARTIEEGHRAIEGRLLALARVQDVMIETGGSSADLATILTAATRPFDTPAASQIVMRVAYVTVAPAAALPLAMILNELCTNAAKYGALSSPAGRVEIEATVEDGGGVLRLVWAEHDGPPVVQPSRRSFGSKLIEHALVAQLQGRASLSFSPTGVRYTLDVPVAAIATPPSS